MSTPLPKLPGVTEQAPFTALDRAFAAFLQERQPSADPRHTWLALLVSHLHGLGHARLDLPTLHAAPQQMLPTWPDAARSLLPPDLDLAADTLPWAGRGDGTEPLVRQGNTLYLRRAWVAEQRILASLRQRLTLAQPAPGQLPPLLDELFGPVPKGQVDWQRVACALAARGRLLLLTGGPGTGKTTTVARLLALLQSQAVAGGAPLRIHLAAPTGKAAARLGESLGTALQRLPTTYGQALQAHPPQAPTTLHRLLRLSPTGDHPPAQPLATDLVVVDEASMIDLEMMARLLACVPEQARLVLLGDKDQLASVEAGAVWAQLCEGAEQGGYDASTVTWLREQAGCDVAAWQAQPPQTTASSAQRGLWDEPAPTQTDSEWAQHTVMLRHSHRFNAQGGIGQWAQALNLGNVQQVHTLWQALPAWAPTEAATITRLDSTATRGQAWVAFLRQGWQRWLAAMEPWRAWSDNATLSTAQQSGVDDALARELLDAFANLQLLCAVREGPWGVQQVNRAVAQALHLPLDGWYAGRPVMVTRNDSALGLMNGDVGLCLPHQGRLRVAFPQGQGGVRWVACARLEAVQTVFAMTVHKSQGSEFDAVLLIVPDRISPLLTRELLYTALTRAKTRATWLAAAPDVLVQAAGQRVWRSGGLGVQG